MSTTPTESAVQAELEHLEGLRLIYRKQSDFRNGAVEALRQRMTPGQVQSSPALKEHAFDGAMHAAWWRLGLRPDAPRTGCE